MKSTDLKINVIDRIIHLKNDELLNEINFLLQLHKKGEETVNLTDEMLSAISKSEKQIKKGEYKEGDSLWKEIDQWPEEKQSRRIPFCIDNSK